MGRRDSRTYDPFLTRRRAGNPIAETAHSSAPLIKQSRAAVHHEDPNSPYFSETGAQAAAGGRRVPGIFQAANIALEQTNPRADIDSLSLVPFHRLSLLAPWAEVAGYGEAVKFPELVATLALRGRPRRNVSTAIEFPPDGSIVPFASMSSPEWPNPLAACPGYRAPVGLPVSIQLSKQSIFVH